MWYQTPPDPAPPEANPDTDIPPPPGPIPAPDPLPPDPTNHPNQVPPPIPVAPPHCSNHTMICQDYHQLHDLFLRPHPTPDHNDPGPEGGAAANTSTIQALEFVYDSSNIFSKNEAPPNIELVFNATITDD